MDRKPYPITKDEWQQLIAVPAVREAWALDDDITWEEFESIVYGAKFNFMSGSPGYFGDLFILQGDALSDVPPMVIKRDRQGNLEVVETPAALLG